MINLTDDQIATIRLALIRGRKYCACVGAEWGTSALKHPDTDISAAMAIFGMKWEYDEEVMFYSTSPADGEWSGNEQFKPQECGES